MDRIVYDLDMVRVSNSRFWTAMLEGALLSYLRTLPNPELSQFYQHILNLLQSITEVEGSPLPLPLVLLWILRLILEVLRDREVRWRKRTARFLKYHRN